MLDPNTPRGFADVQAYDNENCEESQKIPEDDFQRSESKYNAAISRTTSEANRWIRVFFFLFRCAPRISRTRSICPSTHRTVRPPARLSVRPSDRPLLRTQKEDKPAYKKIDFKPLNYLTP